MLNLKKLTLIDRLKNSVKALKGKPIGSVNFGVNISKCSECKYRIHSSEGRYFNSFSVGRSNGEPVKLVLSNLDANANELDCVVIMLDQTQLKSLIKSLESYLD